MKNPYFIKNHNTKGVFSQFWLILSDLRTYLLKELPAGRFFSDKIGLYTRDNALVVPRLIRAAGLDSAEYYIVNWVMDDSVSTWEDDFLLTPSFLKKGDEMLSFKDIFGQECLDIETVENNLRKELVLRHFKKKNIDRFILELRKKICMSEIIDNTDICYHARKNYKIKNYQCHVFTSRYSIKEKCKCKLLKCPKLLTECRKGEDINVIKEEIEQFKRNGIFFDSF